MRSWAVLSRDPVCLDVRGDQRGTMCSEDRPDKVDGGAAVNGRCHSPAGPRHGGRAGQHQPERAFRVGTGQPGIDALRGRLRARHAPNPVFGYTERCCVI